MLSGGKKKERNYLKTWKINSHSLCAPATEGILKTVIKRTAGIHCWALVCSFSALKRFTQHYKLPAAFVAQASADEWSFLLFGPAKWQRGGISICSVTAIFNVQNKKQSASHIKGSRRYLQITACFNQTSLWVLLLSTFLKLIKRQPYQALKANHVLSGKQKLILLL